MGDHKDLKVFRLSNSNALSLYKATRRIKGSDNLAIRSQLTRAAFSIPANIVEGNKAPGAKKIQAARADRTRFVIRTRLPSRNSS
jgi:four helix bundle protein